MIPIFEPCFSGKEKQYLMTCIDTNWISSQGSFIIQFEEELANYHGLKHGIVTSNCTTALHLALKALEIGPGDEVICPDLTFIAPANMIELAGAKVVLVDINPQTLALDPKHIEGKITERTKAIIVVHQFGHAAPMDEIQEIANRFHIKIIEDNAESLGGSYKGKLLGTIGDVSCYSFFANKIITCGEGGAILTNNDEIAKKCRILRDHGMSREIKYHHSNLGYNYRMTNMQAAVGLAQLEQLNSILGQRKKQMDLYYELLQNVSGITLRSFQDWCVPVHWLMTITLDQKYNRNVFLQYMKNSGVDCRQMINPVHQADHFIENYNSLDFPISNSISSRSAHLPSGSALIESQIKYITDQVKIFLLERNQQSKNLLYAKSQQVVT